jgi:ceramide glucosyltransferase
MHLLLKITLYVALAGTITSGVYCLMVLVAAARFGLRRRKEERRTPEFCRRSVS